jgi:hypothetical protein
MEIQRDVAVAGKLAAFSAFQIGIENETALINILQQNHARRRAPVSVDGRQVHGVRIIGLTLFRLSKPFLKKGKWIFGFRHFISRCLLCRHPPA